MADLVDLANNIKSINFVALFDESIEESIEVILDTNQDQLRSHGEDSKGDKLSPEYSASTIARKKSSKTSPVPDLYDTGFMFDEMDMLSQQEAVWDIISYAPYTRKLQEKYGIDIFGIQEKRIDKPAKEVKEKSITKIKKHLKL